MRGPVKPSAAPSVRLLRDLTAEKELAQEQRALKASHQPPMKFQMPASKATGIPNEVEDDAKVTAELWGKEQRSMTNDHKGFF